MGNNARPNEKGLDDSSDSDIDEQNCPVQNSFPASSDLSDFIWNFYCRGDKNHAALIISLQNINEWMNHINLMGVKISIEDTAEIFSKVVEDKYCVNFRKFGRFLHQLALKKKIDVRPLLEQLISPMLPGMFSLPIATDWTESDWRQSTSSTMNRGNFHSHRGDRFRVTDKPMNAIGGIGRFARCKEKGIFHNKLQNM